MPLSQELDGTSVGNKNLKVADVVPRSFEKNFTQQINEILASSNGCEDGDAIDDDLKQGCSNSKARSARDVVTPLAYMPYADQLEHKKSNLVQILKKLVRIAHPCFFFPFLLNVIICVCAITYCFLSK